MTSAVRTTWALWRSRAPRSAADRAYGAYLAVAVALVTVLPLGRVVWMLASDPVLAATTFPHAASTAAMLLVAGCWVAAIVAGRFRGPVVFAPFLAHALSSSALPRRRSLARPVVRAGVFAGVAGGSVGAVVGVAQLAQGVSSGAGIAVLAAAGAASALIGVTLWLIGQSTSGRAAASVAAVIGAGAIGAAVFPAAAFATPVGWVALVYASGGTAAWGIALVASALVAWGCVPRLLARMHATVVLAQSQRWATAGTHAGVFDFSASAATYQPDPSARRHDFAIRPACSLAVMIFRRDVIGATRTPGRSVAGVVLLMCGGVLLTMAMPSPGTSLLVAAAAGVVTYAAVGPFTDGVRHVVEAAGALPLYGVSDLGMLGGHAIMPLLATVALVTVGAALAAPALHIHVGAAAAASVALALCIVAARLMNALKPPLPLALLAPVPSPMGDLSALTRLVWAMDAALLAGLAGVAAALIPLAPGAGMIVFVAVVLITARRWSER